MDIKQLKSKTAAELHEQLIELRREQFNLRMQRGMGQLAKPHELTRVRKDIARVKTVISAQK
jgi:large subunit ribosomal protein L29